MGIITTQENKQTSKANLDVYFIFKTDRKKKTFFLFYYLLSASVCIESNAILFQNKTYH